MICEENKSSTMQACTSGSHHISSPIRPPLGVARGSPPGVGWWGATCDGTLNHGGLRSSASNPSRRGCVSRSLPREKQWWTNDVQLIYRLLHWCTNDTPMYNKIDTPNFERGLTDRFIVYKWCTTDAHNRSCVRMIYTHVTICSPNEIVDYFYFIIILQMW